MRRVLLCAVVMAGVTSCARTTSADERGLTVEAAAAAPSASESVMPPGSTCVPLPTPAYAIETPRHSPVNGQPDLGVPVRRGVILVKIQQCRDIADIMRKYHLPGPATRDTDVAETPEMVALGATRWFLVDVAPGTESTTVVELYRHPDDIEYVQLVPAQLPEAAGE